MDGIKSGLELSRVRAIGFGMGLRAMRICLGIALHVGNEFQNGLGWVGQGLDWGWVLGLLVGFNRLTGACR